jgi:hypothetical protein
VISARSPYSRFFAQTTISAKLFPFNRGAILSWIAPLWISVGMSGDASGAIGLGRARCDHRMAGDRRMAGGIG